MWQCWLKNVCGMGEIRLLTNDLHWSLSQDSTGFPALTSSQSCECVNMFLCWPSVLVRFSFEILRSCVTSEPVLISKFCYSSNERSDSKPPSFVVLHRNSGQLLFCVQVEDPEELCLCLCVCLCECTCVHERGNEALLSLPRNTPVSTPLPLISPFQQGFLCCACLWSCCVSLSSTLPNSHTILYKHFFVTLCTPLPSVCHVLSPCVILRDCFFLSHSLR